MGRAGPVGCPYNLLHGWVVIEFSVISHEVQLLYLPLSGRLVSHSCEWIKLTGGRTEPCGAQAVKASHASALYPLTGKRVSLHHHTLSCHLHVCYQRLQNENEHTHSGPTWSNPCCHGDRVLSRFSCWLWLSLKKSSFFILIGAHTICKVNGNYFNMDTVVSALIYASFKRD